MSATPTPDPTPAPSFDIDVRNERFSSDDRLAFCFFETTQQLSRSLGWYVTQNHNPELSFDSGQQKLEDAHIYLDYYADCTADEARSVLEEYTDTLIQALQYAFPEIDIEMLYFCWRIPAVDEDSLYAATYSCERINGEIIRGSGSGIIY